MNFLQKPLAWLSSLFSPANNATDAEHQKPAVVVFPPVTRLRPEDLAEIYGCSRSLAELYVDHLARAMSRYEINTPLRMAHFLAQVGHESGRLRYTREVWGPTPAQSRYEGRADLGNTVEGDGRRYMGRGLIQLTGRANYAQMAKALGADVVAVPQLVEFPDLAALSAAWFWDSRGLNRFADEDDLLTITRRINGGTNGLVDREKLLLAAKRVLMPWSGT